MVGEKDGKDIRATLRRTDFSTYPEKKDFLHNYNIVTAPKKKFLAKFHNI